MTWGSKNRKRKQIGDCTRFEPERGIKALGSSTLSASAKGYEMKYRCKKCGDIFLEKDYKHYTVCRDTDILDPSEIDDSYDTLHYRQEA